MEDWWIDSSKPGPTRDYMAEFSIQSASGMNIYPSQQDLGTVTIFEEVRGQNAALWIEGDPIFSNGVYFGRVFGIDTHRDVITLGMLAVRQEYEVVDTYYTVTLNMTPEEIEELWNQSPSPQQLSKLLARA